jgi:tetratricopeptide (TPR) repeat protein
VECQAGVVSVSPEQDAALAEQSLAGGDLVHALYHATGAVAAAPDDAAYLELLDRVLAAAPDPLALTALSDKPWYGEVAARSRALYRAGLGEQAVHYLLQIAMLRPDRAFLQWPVGWLGDAGGEVLASEALLPSIAMFVGAQPPGPATAANRPSLDALAAWLGALRGRRLASPRHLCFEAMILRRLGRADESLTVAGLAFEAEATWMNAIAVANARREVGDVDGALAWYERALELSPDHDSIRLDIADLLCDAQRYVQGLERYEQVLARDPNNAWAAPSVHWFRWLATGDDAHRRALDAYVAANPENERAQLLARASAERTTPWVGWLPAPREASIGVLEHLQQAWADGVPAEAGPVVVELTAAEAPSVRLAAKMTFELEGWGVELGWRIADWGEPDPRQPVGDAPLWRWDGEDAVAAVAPPDERIAEAVSGLGSMIFHLRTWVDEAARIARDLGPDAVGDVLAVMVWPTKPPPGCPAWIWVQRLQVAAALIVARLVPADAAVIALSRPLLGPVDWCVDAAIVALVSLVDASPGDARLVASVSSAFNARLQATPTRGYTCYLYPLVVHWLRLPGLAPADRSRLEAWKGQLEATA